MGVAVYASLRIYNMYVHYRSDESTAALMEAEEAERKAAEIEKRKGGKG